MEQVSPNNLVGTIMMGLAAVFVACSPSFSQEFSPWAGGTGGTLFNSNCRSGDALVGIHVNAASYVDSIRGVCASFNEIRATNDEYLTSENGGEGGDPHVILCPKAWVVVGLYGKAGAWLDRIGIICAPLGFEGMPVEDGTRITVRAGGTGGEAFESMCPDGLPARGLRGRAATYVDRIRLRCQPVSMDDIESDSDGAEVRPVIRNLRFHRTVGQIGKFRVDLWNVGGRDIEAGAANVNILGVDKVMTNVTVESFPPGLCHADFGFTGYMIRCTSDRTAHDDSRAFRVHVTGNLWGPADLYTIRATGNGPDGSNSDVGFIDLTSP